MSLEDVYCRFAHDLLYYCVNTVNDVNTLSPNAVAQSSRPCHPNVFRRNVLLLNRLSLNHLVNQSSVDGVDRLRHRHNCQPRCVHMSWKCITDICTFQGTCVQETGTRICLSFASSRCVPFSKDWIQNSPRTNKFPKLWTVITYRLLQSASVFETVIHSCKIILAKTANNRKVSLSTSQRIFNWTKCLFSRVPTVIHLWVQSSHK